MTLIERLRGWLVADYIEAYTTGSTLIREAADEIERLTAERDALLAFLVDLLSVLEPVYQTSPEGRAYLLRINTALAAIDAARKA